jgi:hypothetical protein
VSSLYLEVQSKLQQRCCPIVLTANLTVNPVIDYVEIYSLCAGSADHKAFMKSTATALYSRMKHNCLHRSYHIEKCNSTDGRIGPWTSCAPITMGATERNAADKRTAAGAGRTKITLSALSVAACVRPHCQGRDLATDMHTLSQR